MKKIIITLLIIGIVAISLFYIDQRTGMVYEFIKHGCRPGKIYEPGSGECLNANLYLPSNTSPSIY